MEDLFKRIPQKKVSDKVFEQIKALIVAGKLLPGQKIPPEMELTSLFNVSRSSVREAILKLECLGFVEQKRGDGTFVKSVTQAPIQNYMEEMTGEKDFLAGLMETCTVLETWAAATAADRATDEEIGKLKEIICEMENHKTEKIGFELNVKLHSQITSATHNPFLIHMMGSILKWLSTITQKVYAGRKKYPEIKQELTRQHHRIVKAIADRKPEEASAAMADHLNYTSGRQQRTMTIYDSTLLNVIDNNDYLFVVDITGKSWQGWMKKNVWEWLKKHYQTRSYTY